MVSGLLSLFRPMYAVALVYMLQSTEYQAGPYLRWYWRTANFGRVMRRRTLQRTSAARLLLLAVRAGILSQYLAGAFFIVVGFLDKSPGFVLLGITVIITAPLVWAHIIVLPLILGRLFIIRPRERQLINQSAAIFNSHPGVKIAVAGSYGKTSMKELLLTVLSEGKTVSATPANKNVASSHAVFAASLSGKEEILIIEYGEGRPGDVARFAVTTRPDIGIITGLAPAHLDHYPTLKAAGEDIFSLADHLNSQQVYVNSESVAVHDFIKPEYNVYNSGGALGWRVSNIKVDYDGTYFEMKKDNQHLKLHSELLGKHQVGPLALAAALALKLGLSQSQVERGIAKTSTYEHRMQPRHISGAWIIDDTYNGNIDGMKAGLQLLQDLPATIKTYVTPGLVDQGVETEKVHLELGKLIAQAQPDKVVLMKNSVTNYIKTGMKHHGYSGELRIENDPLKFYTNIDHFLAHGDLVVMQNDWTDNYN